MESHSTQSEDSNRSLRSSFGSGEIITPDYVRTMKRASDRLFCQLRDNNLIRFGSYEIRDYQSGLCLLEITEDQQNWAHNVALQEEDDGLQSLDTRTIKYGFGPDFLELQTLSLKLEFHVIGDEPIKDLLLIERFYFKDRLLTNFEFQFPFCMPKSQNQCEFIYDLPQLTEEEKEEMINSPWVPKSDSFFFVNNQLIIHNKAAYNYSRF